MSVWIICERLGELANEMSCRCRSYPFNIQSIHARLTLKESNLHYETDVSPLRLKSSLHRESELLVQWHAICVVSAMVTGWILGVSWKMRIGHTVSKHGPPRSAYVIGDVTNQLASYFRSRWLP